MKAIRGDLERIDEAEGAATQGTLFVAAAARAPRGTTKLVAIDWSSGEAREVELALDPANAPRDQVEALFKRAQRLKKGGPIATARLRDAERSLQALESIAARARDAGVTPPMLDALAQEARAAAPRDFSLASASSLGAAVGLRRTERDDRGQPRSRPYRTFRDASGARILVGRTSEQNDHLTQHVARPQDLWLHVKSRTGAHVIVPLAKNVTCPAELLIDAAHLAAHFSAARGDGVVEVQHTPRRYVRKPRGSAPGLVVVSREKVVVLRFEPPRLARLLATEELA